MTVVEALSIILAVVSLIITTVGFFASLKFYRDGVELQKLANDALVKLEEKTQTIQTQVGGMFERTLDAAIGRRNELSENFEDLNAQLAKAQAEIMEEAVKQVVGAGEKERSRLSQVIDSNLSLIREKIETTRESAEDAAFKTFLFENPNADVKTKILALLSFETRSISRREIVDRLSGFAQPASLSRRLHELVHMGAVIATKEPNGLSYRLSNLGYAFLQETKDDNQSG